MAEQMQFTGDSRYFELAHGERVTRIRTYYYNGEHWAKCRRADGSVADVPDVLLRPVTV